MITRVALVMGVLAAGAAAQESQAPPARPVTWTFRVPTAVQFNTNFDDGQPGDVTVTRLGAELGVGIPIATMSQLDLGFEYEYSRYDFSNATGFGGVANPWTDIHRETFRARYGQQQDMQLSWLVGGFVGLSGEEGADAGDSVHAGVYGGVGYNLSRSLKIGGVVGVFTRIEDDPIVLPIPSLDWEIDPQWRLSTAGKPGLTVFFSPNDQWTLSLGAWYESRDFRLDESGPVPGGVGREEGWPVAFGATFRPTPNLSLDLGAGVRVLETYELLDASGNGLGRIDADPTPFVSFTLGVKF